MVAGLASARSNARWACCTGPDGAAACHFTSGDSGAMAVSRFLAGSAALGPAAPMGPARVGSSPARRAGG